MKVDVVDAVQMNSVNLTWLMHVAQALKNIRIMQQLGRIAAISAAAALLVAVCSGVAIISPLSIALAAVSSAAVWARSRLHAFEQRFIFTDWRHCEIA